MDIRTGKSHLTTPIDMANVPDLGCVRVFKICSRLCDFQHSFCCCQVAPESFEFAEDLGLCKLDLSWILWLQDRPDGFLTAIKCCKNTLVK